MRCWQHVFLLILLSNAAFAQTFQFQQYSSQNGLPGNNVFALAEDSSGYMWIGTDEGLFRFDGSQFSFLLRSDTLIAGKPVTALKYNSSHKLFAGTADNRLLEIDQYKAAIVNRKSAVRLAINSIIVQNQRYFLFHDFFNIETFNKNPLHPETATVLSTDSTLVPYCSHTFKSNTSLTGTNEGLFTIDENKLSKYVIKGLPEGPVYAIATTAESLLLGGSTWIATVKDDVVQNVYETGISGKQNIKHLTADRNGNIWFGFWGDDDLYILDASRLTYSLFEAAGIRKGIISCLTNDRSGDIWLSVLGNGLYRFPALLAQPFLPTAMQQNVAFTCMKKYAKDKFVMGTQNGLLFYNAITGESKSFKLDPNLFEYVKAIATANNTIAVATTDMRLREFKIQDKSFIFDGDTLQIKYRHASTINLSGQYLTTGNWDGQVMVENLQTRRKMLFHPYGVNENIRITGSVLLDHQQLLCGSAAGLVVVNIADHTIVKTEAALNLLPVFDISANSDGSFAVFTSGSIINFKDRTFTSSKTYQTESKINAFYSGYGDTSFVADKSGLRFYTPFDTISIGKESGIYGEDIEDIYFDRERQRLIICAPSGISTISIRAMQIFQQLPPRILARNIFTSSGTLPFLNGIEIPYAGDFRSIEFSSLHGNKAYAIIQLTDESGKMHFALNSNFDLSALSPGTHVLQVCGINEQGIQGPKSFISFRLIPPFYRTDWFYIASFVFAGGMLFTIRKKYLGSRRRKEEAQNSINYKINLLRQQALIANLNPHFIFNALNAIQSYINTNHLTTANEYLTLFAKLMRQQLNTAGKDYIVLREELSRINNYVAIEKMRFGENLQFELLISNEIDADVMMIPNMIIQPFIENAIWHAFSGLETAGKITLAFKYVNNTLVISVTDNGKGFAENKKAMNGDLPHGINMIKERLELMSPKGHQPLSIEKAFPTLENSGTLVNIILMPGMFQNR